MKPFFYFDLDGVIRDLVGAIPGFDPKTWNDNVPCGQTMCEYLYEHLECLVTAPKTQYCDAIARLDDIHILTCQPPAWRLRTQFWIERHLPNAQICFVSHFQTKLDMLRPGDILVEDYPFFPDYSQICLIDQPYNRNVSNPLFRVRNIDELLVVLSSSYPAAPVENKEIKKRNDEMTMRP